MTNGLLDTTRLRALVLPVPRRFTHGSRGVARERRASAFHSPANAALLGLYALAAVLGLFLHTAGTAPPGRHVSGAIAPGLERDGDARPGLHEEARCSLGHRFVRLAVAIPLTGRAPVQRLEPVAMWVESRHRVLPSSPTLVVRSRAPPLA